VANNVKQIWASGKAVVNGWLAIPSGFSAEVLAQTGFDSVIVDLQHGVQDYLSMVECFQAMQAHPVTPMVRVPWNEPGIIGKVLDAGAYGVICPMINTRAQCEHFVKSCRYAPLGHRSMGPVRATLYAGSDYGAKANGEMIAMAMIETVQAVDNIDEILSTPGLDAIFIGPSDLSVSFGHSAGFDPRFPKVYDAIVKVAEACKRHGIVAGIHTGSLAYTREMEALGFRFFAYLSELRFMATAGAEALASLRSTHAQVQEKSY